MNQSMIELLRERANRISKEGCQLIGDFSGMHPLNTPRDDMVFISWSGDYLWNNLAREGKQIQVMLLPEVDRFIDLIIALTQNIPSGVHEGLQNNLKKVRSSIEQEEPTWWKSKGEAVEGFRALLKEIVDTIENYYSVSADEVIAIPDTNALLHNPDIEHWWFKGVEHFTIILTPAVLSELDEHKVNHRNQQVRDKASSLIRKVKEYRSRGPLYRGVVIVKDKVSLRSIANEPNMTQSLPWFDPTNKDDRFLATTIEIMRDNLGINSFVVTTDINMQNKAEMAGIPLCDVPIPFIEKEDQ